MFRTARLPLPGEYLLPVKEIDNGATPPGKRFLLSLRGMANHPHLKTQSPRFFYGYVIVLAGLFILMLTNGTMYSFSVFLKPVSEEFGWARAMTTGAYSLFLFVLACLYLVTGRLSDRFGPRILITVCGLLLGLGYLLMSQVSSLWHLYLLYGVLVASGMSGGFVPLTSTVARWFVKRRGVMTGIVVAGAGLGVVVMPPLSSWLISNYGWRTCYMIIGGIALALIMLAAQFLRRDPAKMRQQAYGEHPNRDACGQQSAILQISGFSFREARHTRQFWMLCLIYFCFGSGMQSIMAHIVSHATDLGISALTAANIVAVIGGVNIVGRVGTGIISDRAGNRASLVAVLASLAAAFFWLQVTRELWSFYIFAIVFGFSMGGGIALESPVVVELFGLKEHGSILGFVVSISIIGGALGSFMAGRIFDMTGNYYPAFWVAAGAGITGTVMALLLKPLPGASSAQSG